MVIPMATWGRRGGDGVGGASEDMCGCGHHYAVPTNGNACAPTLEGGKRGPLFLEGAEAGPPPRQMLWLAGCPAVEK